MFIGRLRENEKYALASLLISLAASDGSFQDEEKELIIAYAENLDIDVYTEGPSRPIKDICKEFSSYQSRIIAIQKLMELSISDEVFHDKEIEFIMEVAGYMEIEEEILLQIEQWARNFKLVRDQGLLLLSEQD